MSESTDEQALDHRYTGLEIAVIGMAGRFPQAEDIPQFWENLVSGVDAISRFTAEELEDMGVAAQLLTDERYVRAKGVIPHLDSFDASFFNYAPADAQLMDPQVRVLHEEVFHALEDAGYSAEGRPESIGLFLGSTNNMAWEAHTLSRYLKDGPTFAGMQLNDKDFAATRIAYALNLRGPALSLHTACSTSLVAIDLACRNLLTGACQIAVAGGSGLTLPHKNGYLFQEGMIHSPDGSCRAFDEQAEGTVEGNGAGAVVLKRLETARRDGDHIYAVIRSTATNNDGSRKVGYTAPSVDGQADVIRKAQRLAQVAPADISYVETHGTGTRLGDPIEVEALRQAFGATTATGQACGIGSLKPNIGHLDAAAGVASFIKTVKILEQAIVPPSLHFKTLNTNISLENSPFHVVAEREELTRRQRAGKTQPLRAGVSSFGIGGTNAHVVLEEAPRQPRTTAGRRFNTLTLSAHSPDALRAMKAQLRDHVVTHPELDPSDLAWTVQNRQRRLTHRYAVEYADTAQLAERLTQSLNRDERPFLMDPGQRREVCFLFSGLGAQHVAMARDLYTTEPDLRQRLDACFDTAADLGRADLRELFLSDGADAEAELNRIDTTQLMLFILEVCVAQQLITWGVRPTALIGHSTGEFAAACVAGVFSLQDGIRLIHARGTLMDQTAPGAMMTAKASRAVVEEILTDDLTMAAVNSPEDCSVSGPEASIEAFAERCVERGISMNRLAAAHAYHSDDMVAVLPRFAAVLESVELHAPRIRYVSNLTGTWITDEQATSPDYYCAHLRSCVQFADGVGTLLKSGSPLFVEVGPGKALSSFARHCGTPGEVVAVNVLRHRLEEITDDVQLARAVRKLWENGLALDWKAFHAGRAPAKVALPLYPFDRTPFPIDIEDFQRHYESDASVAVVPRPRRQVGVPIVPQGSGAQHVVWSQSVVPGDPTHEVPRTVVVLSHDQRSLRRVLEDVPHWRCLPVDVSDRYTFGGQRGSSVRRGRAEDAARLVTDLAQAALLPDTFVVHVPADDLAASLLLALADSLANLGLDKAPTVLFLDEADAAHRSGALLGLLIGLNLQFEGVRIASVCGGPPLHLRAGHAAWRAALLTELGPVGPRDVAVRHTEGRRMVPRLQALSIQGLPAAGHGRTLLLCEMGDLDEVIKVVREDSGSGAIQVQPYHVGDDLPWRPPTYELPRQVSVLEPVMSRTATAVASRMRARAASIELFDEVVIWDPVPDPATPDPSFEARADLYRAFRHLRGGPVPLAFLSPTGLVRGQAWTTDATLWLVDAAGLDADLDATRLFVHANPGRLDDACLGVLRLMRRFGVPAAHLGADPVRMVGEGKVPGDDTELGESSAQIQESLGSELGELLGLASVDPNTDMFDLGLDSIKLLQFVSGMERQGVRMLAADVYSNSTVRELAQFIAAQGPRKHQAVADGDEVAALLSDLVGAVCTSVVVDSGDADRPAHVMLVEGLDADLHRRCIRALAESGVPAELQPDHLLAGDAGAALVDRPTFETLRQVRGAGSLDVQALYDEVQQGQERLRGSIAAQPVRWTYPISGMQRQHFASEVRLQLYLISFTEVVDVPTLERALCDVIGRHGMMRSVLIRRLGQLRWREFEAPTEVDLPLLDISRLRPDEQDEAVAALVKREWSMDFKVVDKPMYQMFLLKFSEKRYDLVFQFDHSIFDVTSGQILRSDLMRRYSDLLHGGAEAMPVAKSYRHLQDQINKGPVNISPDEIIEKFELDRYVHHAKRIKKKSAHLADRPIFQVRYSVDLQQIRKADGEELELFSLVVHLYSRLVARLIGVDKVACDILFQSRVFEDKDYSEVMGMVLGGLPFVIPAERAQRASLLPLIRSKVDMMNRNNVSFLNLIHDARSLLRYRRVFAVTKEVAGRSFHTSCLLNFVGVVEDEYEAIWDMTLAQLEDEQAKLDYADCYCVSKVSGDRVDLLLLTRWGDAETVSSILDDEVLHLAGPDIIVPSEVPSTPVPPHEERQLWQ